MIDQILTWPNLCDAWERMADNRGAPGPDKVSIARFARNWEENLRRLERLVRSGGYRPGRLRRVAIPKRGGGQRLLSIANVGDRVLQRAALNVLDDLFERRFYACSYGYRPGRGLRDAVAAILRFRDSGRLWVLDADIDDCFDSLDHGLLCSLLGQAIGDPDVMHLLRLWITNGRRYKNPDRGIAQGMPIAPLFCNVYLHELDKPLVLGRWKMVRYADDFIVCCRTEAEAQRAYDRVAGILAGLKLRYEPRKTQLTSFRQEFDFLGVHFSASSYSFLWQDKRFEITGPTPRWLWGYAPRGYEG